MEIRIKTHEEFKIDRMTIEIRSERDEIGTASGHSSGEFVLREVEDLRGQLKQANRRALELDAVLAEAQSENDRMARDLDAQVSLNRAALSVARTSDNAAIRKDMKIAELERQLESALSRIETLEKRRSEERTRADQNAVDRSKAEAKLAVAIAKLGEIRTLLPKYGDDSPGFDKLRQILDRESSTIE